MPVYIEPPKIWKDSHLILTYQQSSYIHISKSKSKSKSIYFNRCPVYVPDTKSTLPHAALEAHNKYRALHHSSPLNWSESLATQAQALAESLVTRGNLQGGRHDTSTVNLGQNLAKLAGMCYYGRFFCLCRVGEKTFGNYVCVTQIKDKQKYWTNRDSNALI